MKLNLIIPTLGRELKLLKCLGSIELAKRLIPDERLYVYVYFSNEKEFKSLDRKLFAYPWILTRLLDKPYNASEFWNNHLKEQSADIYYYINDDVILAPDCLKNSIDNMNKLFSDLDGVIGFNQENIPPSQQCRAAFGCIGNKFVNRFPERKVFCEAYKRFYLDQELYEYSSKVGKHYFDMSSKLIHCHPSFDSKYMDNTHTEVRKYLNKDKKTYENRKKKGLLWGETF
jgi:hypothetical protein